MITSRDLDTRVTFQRNERPSGRGKAGQESWQAIGDPVWAQVRDVLPSRSESTDDGLPQAVRRARVRIRHREDITPDMRILHGVRVMRIISGAAELGRREWLELMAEDYSTSGSGA